MSAVSRHALKNTTGNIEKEAHGPLSQKVFGNIAGLRAGRRRYAL
jgi:hypothetical protein